MPSPASIPSGPTPNATQFQRPRHLVLTACQTDDVSLISHALSLASPPGSPEAVRGLLSQAVTQSIRRNSTKVLTYVLENGAEVPAYSSLNVEDPSKATLEILVAHGWDINARRAGDRPFLWEVVGDGDLVTWCLNHGATAIPRELGLVSDDERRKDEYGCPPILEVAASESTVTTFELLRSKGGRLGRRTLHFAAKAAIKSQDREELPEMSDRDRAKLPSERMALVIYLVDTLELDPNALDQPTGWLLGNHLGTPLCYVAQSNPNWDCSEVVGFLLRKGADPGLVIDPAGWDAVELAKRCKNRRFLDLVDDWKARQADQK